MFKSLCGLTNPKSQKIIKRSTDIPKPDYNELIRQTVFSSEELQKLFLRFSMIAEDDGLVTMTTFCSQPEIFNCRLIKIAFESVCPPNGAIKGIEFDEFVFILSKFSTRTSKEEKTTCFNFFNFLIF